MENYNYTFPLLTVINNCSKLSANYHPIVDMVQITHTIAKLKTLTHIHVCIMYMYIYTWIHVHTCTCMLHAVLQTNHISTCTYTSSRYTCILYFKWNTLE